MTCHRYCADGGDAGPYFRSIMAYSCASSDRVPYFSSPNAFYQGRSTGTCESRIRRCTSVLAAPVSVR
jgi:hypothetical protein